MLPDETKPQSKGGITQPASLSGGDLPTVAADRKIESGMVDAPSAGQLPTRGNEISGPSSAVSPGWSCGQILASRYELLEIAGRGGMGEVWKARDARLGRIIAIKTIRGELAASQSHLARFVLEARAVASLNHPGIVQIHDHASDSDTEFLVLEFVSGPSLADKLRGGQPLSVSAAALLLVKVCRAIEAAHDKNILHRDIKPANILMTSDGEPKVADFGLARSGTGGLTVSGGALGTPFYMAPEQWNDARVVDLRADVYGLGATFYHMLTGTPPHQIRPDLLPEEIRTVVERALEPSPELRYSSVAEFRSAIQGCVDSDSQSPDNFSCLNCDAMKGGDERFCLNCGSSLFIPCLQCGSELEVRQQFCGQCGHDARSEFLIAVENLKCLQVEVGQLRESDAIAAARTRISAIRIPEHAAFRDFTQWLESEREMLNATPETPTVPKRTLGNFRSGIEIDTDYAAAIDAIQTIGHTRYFQATAGSENSERWRQQAEGGDPKAKWLYADWLTEVVADEDAYRKAITLLRQAFAEGLTRAGVTIGHFYARGLTAEPDQYEAFRWYRDAASKGENSAVFAMACAYMHGHGTGSNPSRAVELLEQGTASGCIMAKSVLGRLLVTGQIIEQDLDRAFMLQREAAIAGRRTSQQILGTMLLDGTGTSVDKDTAIDWLTRSAKLGDRHATTILESLEILNFRMTNNDPQGIVSVLIESGSYQMGSSDPGILAHPSYKDESPQHMMTITKPFWLGREQVTREQYQAVTGTRASMKGLLQLRRGRHPVESVSWFRAVDFCNRLSQLVGLSPFYEVSGSTVRYLGGYGYRLPTEAEWELACRAGTLFAWSWGDDGRQASPFAHCRPHTSGSSSRPRGKRKPNWNGLYDMHGNVWEWCYDFYGEYLEGNQTDPTGLEEGKKRVIRGGNFGNKARSLRSAYRYQFAPDALYLGIGMRLVKIR